MTYPEQLRDPRWKQRRQEIIDIAGGVCENCGGENLRSDQKLEVHHGVYIKGKMAWEYENELLYCLCPECHWNIQGDLDLLYLEIGKRGLDIDRIRATLTRFEIWQDIRDSKKYADG